MFPIMQTEAVTGDFGGEVIVSAWVSFAEIRLRVGLTKCIFSTIIYKSFHMLIEVYSLGFTFRKVLFETYC